MYTHALLQKEQEVYEPQVQSQVVLDNDPDASLQVKIKNYNHMHCQ